MIKVLPLALCAALMVPATSQAARRDKKQVLEELAPWATDPDRIKLEIVERLVLEKQQYQTALPIIAAMRQEGITAPVLDLLQGIAMREQGLQSEAEIMLTTARKRMPGDARVHEALCVLYADQQRVDAAVAACEKATKVDQDRASAWNNLGYLYVVSDRPSEAVQASRRAVELDGSEPRFRNNLAIALVSDDQLVDAFQTFRSASSEADAQYNMGFAIERFKGEEEAMVWYRRAVEAEPQHIAAARAVERITHPELQEPNP